MTGLDRIQAIRRKYFGEGESIRGIARELGMSRRTVRRYVQPEGPWQYTLQKPRQRPVSDSIEPVVREIIERDEQGAIGSNDIRPGGSTNGWWKSMPTGVASAQSGVS